MQGFSNRSAAPRQRRSREQWSELIAAQASSGMSQKAYCDHHDVALSSFCRWRSLLDTTSPSTSPIAFVELSRDRADISEPAWHIELALGDGMVLRLRRT